MVVDISNKKNDIKLKKSDRIPNPPSKIVIRKLPPTFTEEDFKDAIAPVPEYNYFYFATADRSLGQHSYSRAYISFTNPEEVLIFKDQVDGYVFVDQKGNEFPAIVEYAPFQKIPKVFTHQKKDPRCGSIDEDGDYIAFLESLKNPEAVVLPQIENILEEIENQEKELKANNGVPKVKTPLLEYVEQRAIDRLRPGDKRRRKEFDRKRAREEEKRRRKDIKEFRKKEERGTSMSSSASSYRERQKRREEERQRLIEMREKEKKERRARDSKYGTTHSSIEDKEALRQKSPGGESSFKSKRYSEARKKDDKRQRESTREAKFNERRPQTIEESKSDQAEIDEGSKNQDTLQRDLPENEMDSDKKNESLDHAEEDKHEASMQSPIRENVDNIIENDNNDDPDKINKAPQELEIPDDIQKETKIEISDDKKSEFKTTSPVKEKSSADCDSLRSSSDGFESESLDKYEMKDCSEYKRSQKKDEKDPRTGRRIRNKDRPDMQLYRPGQSRLSRLKQNEDGSQERGNDDSSSSSPSPVQGKEEKKDEHPAQESKEDKSNKEKSFMKDYKGNYDKRGGHRYREPRGDYFWENDWKKDSTGKYKDDAESYEESSSKGPSQRKGYSYTHERENKSRRASRSKDQESSQVKSMTFNRSTSQE